LITLTTDTAKITALKTKFEKYGPYAIRQGLKASSDYLNSPAVKAEMYPANRNGSPFVWSSERQRRFVMATVDLPYSRTGGLAAAGQFKVNENSFWVEYTNSIPWWKYVLHPSWQIIGHRTRGWVPVNRFVVNQSGKIVPIFKRSALDAWKEMDTFMYSGGAGL
jgi:hypothetical protein